jgi:hypothetical protein
MGLTAAHPNLPVAVASGIATIVDSLLAPETPRELVIAALQGLIPVEDTSRQVLKTVAEARQLQPFLRGACEGLLYYMLEARQETRGRFATNVRLPKRLAADRTKSISSVSTRGWLSRSMDPSTITSSVKQWTQKNRKI